MRDGAAKAASVVSMCVCANLTFADLIRLARERGWDMEELAKRTGATRGCGLCRRYVADALASGESSFPVRPL